MSDFKFKGRISTFGGPEDEGVQPDEGLAYVEPHDLESAHFNHLFLKNQPENTSGLARRLNPAAFYCAMRFPKTSHWREIVRESQVLVTNHERNTIICTPVDWGPALRTGRIIDLSPAAEEALNVETDDEVVAELFSFPQLD